MKKSKKSKGLPIVLAVIFVGLTVLIGVRLNYFFFAKEVKNKMSETVTDIEEPIYRFIAHAGGSVDGITYTNSK